jgi:hypothetical protein
MTEVPYVMAGALATIKLNISPLYYENYRCPT